MAGVGVGVEEGEYIFVTTRILFSDGQQQPNVRLFVPGGKSHSWCFQPSQPHRITTRLNTNFTLSPSYTHFTSHHTRSHVIWSLFIFRGHSTREPASGRVTYFILLAYKECSHSQHRRNRERFLEKSQNIIYIVK